MVFGIEHESGQRLAQLGLADTGGPEEQEGTVGTVGIGKAGTRTADRIAYQLHCFVLTNDALVQLVFHVQQLVAFALHHLGYRDAGRAADHFGDLFRADLGAQQFVLLSAAPRFTRLFALRGFFQFGFELRQLAVLQLGDLFQFALALQRCHLGLDVVDLFL